VTSGDKLQLPASHPVPGEQESRMGIYLHVPFCPHICPYCDFLKTSRFSRPGVDAFFAGVLAQCDELLPRYVAWAQKDGGTGERPWSTLYFGGGTPGLFDADRFRPLVDRVRAHVRIEEFTLETNPYTNKETRFAGYANLGVNRVTLGAQSLCQNTLSFLGRKHTPADVLCSIASARNAGIQQIQVDLIYGLAPGVRRLSVGEEVRRLAEAGATGVSAYALTLEERTAFAKRAQSPVNDEVAADEASVLFEACLEHGFVQRESSNFSKFPARHNNVYWYGLPYLGLGTGAHGHFPPTPTQPFGERYRVGILPAERAPGDDSLPFEDNAACTTLFERQSEGPRDAKIYVTEMIFTLLRTPTGLPQDWLAAWTRSEALSMLRADARIDRALAENLLTWDARGLRLSPTEKIRGDMWCALVASALA